MSFSGSGASTVQGLQSAVDCLYSRHSLTVHTLPVTRFVQANYSKLVWARSDEGYEMEIVRNRVGGRGVISRVRDRGVDRRGRSI